LNLAVALRGEWSYIVSWKSDLDDIKVSIERALPADVVVALRDAEVHLTLSPSDASAELQPIVDISDELAERELLEEMVSYRKDVTGVTHTIFISPKGKTKHAARNKIAIEPPDTLNPDTVTASIEISNAKVVAGKTPDTDLQKQVKAFIELNRSVLMDYWEYRIDTKQLTERLKSI
jgi:hypothetical protein